MTNAQSARRRWVWLGLLVVAWVAVPTPGAAHVGFGMAPTDLLDPGESYSFTFELPGSAPYHCHPHPSMIGNVTVLAGMDPEGPKTHLVRILDDGAYRFEPAAITVRAGDTVTWTNQGELPHNVVGAHRHTPPPGAGADEPFPFVEVLVGLSAVGLVVVLLRRR